MCIVERATFTVSDGELELVKPAIALDDELGEQENVPVMKEETDQMEASMANRLFPSVSRAIGRAAGSSSCQSPTIAT
jgi:hypothetical protein